MDISVVYHNMCKIKSDINEHLPTLKEYADKCTHITECGVRSVVSSWAFAFGLLYKTNARLIQVDLHGNNTITMFGQVCRANNIDVQFYEQSDLECPLEPTELLFIDTWHVYGHLKRELARWNSNVSKYIILHDTTVDEWQGETIRNNWDAEQQSKDTGIPVNEINKGLWPAIDEFLKEHPEWVIDARYYNNNGLTILKRV